MSWDNKLMHDVNDKQRRQFIKGLALMIGSTAASSLSSKDAFATAMDRIYANPSMAAAALWISATTSEERPFRAIRRAPDRITEFGAGRFAFCDALEPFDRALEGDVDSSPSSAETWASFRRGQSARSPSRPQVNVRPT